MKKNLLLTLVLFLASCTFVSAQKYNEQDKEGLRAFLRQPSAIEGRLNLELLHLAISDTTNWKTSEAWVEKLPLTKWNSNSKKEIIEITWGNRPLKGKLNCSPFIKLLFLDISRAKLTEIDVTKNTELTYLDFSYNAVSNIDVFNNKKLRHLNCNSNLLTELELYQNTDLEFLSCGADNSYGPSDDPNERNHNKIPYLDLAQNTKLEYLECHYLWLENLDISNNTKLTYLDCSSNKNVAPLNIYNHTELVTLDCHDCNLRSLDLSRNTKLTSLECRSNRLSSLDLTQSPMLTTLNCYYNNLTSLDISKCPNLDWLICSDNKLSKLDITNNTNLRRLSCDNNMIESINLSDQHGLTDLYCGTNKLSNLDVSKCEYIRLLTCDGNNLTTLDLSKNINLITLACHNNNLTELIIPNSNTLNSFACSNNNLTKLDLSKHTSLNHIICNNNKLEELIVSNPRWGSITHEWQNNNLKFSTMPYPKGSAGTIYTPQAIINGGVIDADNLIDISDEYYADGNTTTYRWYDKSDKEVTLTNTDPGKFIAGPNYKGQILTCRMTNNTFPDLVLEYKVQIKSNPALQDHLIAQLNNNYALNKGQKFRVFANVSGIDADDIRFGLYDQSDAEFSYDVKILSREGNMYTCQLEANTFASSYMIAPYIYKDGKRTMIERTKETHFIDRLPLKVIDNNDDDIWGRSTKSYIPSQDITAKYMRANINGKVNEKLEVEQDTPFMINIATSSSDNVRIGLFRLNGKFVKDITTKVKGATYTCIVSDVSENIYIVMPYTKQNGTVQVIEREAKSGIMDRLPIKVNEEDIWGRAISKEAPLADANITAYLNNATNVVEIKGVDGVVDVEIYSLATGTLAKRAKVAASEGVNIQLLGTGIYIVNVKTATGKTFSNKIKKD